MYGLEAPRDGAHARAIRLAAVCIDGTGDLPIREQVDLDRELGGSRRSCPSDERRPHSAIDGSRCAWKIRHSTGLHGCQRWRPALLDMRMETLVRHEGRYQDLILEAAQL